MLAFVIGERYGQQVGKNNKVVDYQHFQYPIPTYTCFPYQANRQRLTTPFLI